MDKKNQVPTHLIHGVLDPVVIKEFLHQVQSAFTEKIDITYLEGGHFICDEQPHEVADAIRKFLNEK